jgi:small basic protein
MHLAESLSVFALASVVVAYIPGRIALRVARITVAPLDTIALSINLGLVLSATIYWFLAYFSFQQYFVLWIAVSTGIFAYLWRKEWAWPRFCIKGPHLLLIATILLGVLLLAVLPIYYSNMTATEDGGMKVCPLFDASFHAAIANELTHSVPPKNPVFSGQPLSYHIGADLPAAIYSQITGLGVPELTTRFIPTLVFILTILSVFCFSRLWLASDYGAALATFLIVFGEDLSFIPGLLRGSVYDWSVQYFSVPSVLSLFCVNPMLPALGLLFVGLYCLLKSTREQQLTWQLLAGLFFAALAECKIFTAMQLGVSLALASVIYFAAFRNSQILRWTVVTAIFAAPALVGTFLSNQNGAQIGASLFQSHALGEMMQQSGLEAPLASLSPPPLSFAITVAIYLIGSLGLRVIGLPGVVKEILRPRAESPARYLLAAFILIGIALGLAVTIVPKGIKNGYDNGVWFYVHSKYAAWIFAVEAVLVMIRNRMLSRTQAAVVAAIVVAASVPSTIQHFVFFNTTYKSVVLSPDTVRLLDYLRSASHPGEVVLSTEELVGPIVAMTKCHVPAGSYAEYMVPTKDYRHRIADFKDFWTDWRDGHTRDDILRAYGVSYFVMGRQNDLLPKVTGGLVVTFENREWIVYRVTDVSPSNTLVQMNQRWSV